MVVCEYDKEISGEVLGWKLPAWQAVLLHRVLPSCGGLVVYLLVICFDFALIVENIIKGDKTIATICSILMVLPALISVIFTLASPPPGLQTEESAFSLNIHKKEIFWIVTQISNIVFFPVAAIGRYTYLIFWWTEAMYASREEDDERIKEAISRARKPSPMELYLFLQSFIHSAPIAVVNLLDMMGRFNNPAFDKINIQAVSLVASSLRMASTATMYRRFEREKLCGRRYPWNLTIGSHVMDKTDTQENPEDGKDNETEHIYEPILKRRSTSSREYDREQVISDMIQFSPRSSEAKTKSSLFFDDTESDTSSDYTPPVSPEDRLDSDDEYVRPISIIDRVAPYRRNTQPEYVIETVDVPPPPLAPAPRPGTLAVWAERMVENAEALPAWLSAPPRRKHREIVQEEPDIPHRAPRWYMRGLEPPDTTAALVHFLGWYSFFVARLLSIAAFINFFPVLAIIILFSHYQVMLLFLIVPQASSVRRSFYLFLAFVYLFCLMEFKIRFRHVRVWHAFWFLVCTVEIIIFILLWATIDNKLHDWWRNYVVCVTLGAMSLSYALLLVYFLILQPRETVIQINKTDGKDESNYDQFNEKKHTSV
ncbi:uncharacterized protein LOC121729552 [Aricia agestis]|uniref:uncharacterized protein LOC121729552 n=1 Tax=Aricia agestis TaxID=91739 RepID=UPI001C201873|nr:uncharacterized protein LOC121729552 [Aricia agestis]